MIAPSSSNAAQAFAVQLAHIDLEHVDRARPRADARPMLEEPKTADASHQFGRLCANASATYRHLSGAWLGCCLGIRAAKCTAP
jgi:hypothetical protein